MSGTLFALVQGPFRLRGYGYGLRESEESWVVTTLLENAELFEIDKAAVDAPMTGKADPNGIVLK
ncbi:hypothetical protein [Ruegeria arenilitoris]|uniref:hypothetical protein n=1 Tax=Ruegeria arenilitoris TaxID=1173585 RepID=UPI00147C43AE|nr:hypothetical protein [Ruegeria arenilitoris]